MSYKRYWAYDFTDHVGGMEGRFVMFPKDYDDYNTSVDTRNFPDNAIQSINYKGGYKDHHVGLANIPTLTVKISYRDIPSDEAPREAMLFGNPSPKTRNVPSYGADITFMRGVKGRLLVRPIGSSTWNNLFTGMHLEPRTNAVDMKNQTITYTFLHLSAQSLRSLTFQYLYKHTQAETQKYFRNGLTLYSWTSGEGDRVTVNVGRAGASIGFVRYGRIHDYIEAGVEAMQGGDFEAPYPKSKHYKQDIIGPNNVWTDEITWPNLYIMASFLTGFGNTDDSNHNGYLNGIASHKEDGLYIGHDNEFPSALEYLSRLYQSEMTKAVWGDLSIDVYTMYQVDETITLNKNDFDAIVIKASGETKQTTVSIMESIGWDIPAREITRPMTLNDKKTTSTIIWHNVGPNDDINPGIDRPRTSAYKRLKAGGFDNSRAYYNGVTNETPWPKSLIFSYYDPTINGMIKVSDYCEFPLSDTDTSRDLTDEYVVFPYTTIDYWPADMLDNAFLWEKPLHLAHTIHALTEYSDYNIAEITVKASKHYDTVNNKLPWVQGWGTAFVLDTTDERGPFDTPNPKFLLNFDYDVLKGTIKVELKSKTI